MKMLKMYYQCWWLEVTKQRSCMVPRQVAQWWDLLSSNQGPFQFPSLESLGFDHRGRMNKAIAYHGGITLDDYTKSNQTSWFQHQAFGHDPFGSPRRLTWGYCVTAPGGIVICPSDGKQDFLILLQDEIVGDHYSVAYGIDSLRLLICQEKLQSTQQQCISCSWDVGGDLLG